MVDTAETLDGSLEDLRAFCAVVEFGTVSAAARLLGETKGGVSRRLSRLERRLGVALLARTPRAVSPTGEGAAFYAKAREGLSLLDDAAEAARRSRSVPRGHLRVTAPMDIGIDVLPALVVSFRRAHPQITVELLLTDAPLDLASNRVDLALRATPGDLPDMGYRAAAVAAFRIGLYAAPAYLAARGRPEAPSDLSGHDLVTAREAVGAAQMVLADRRGRTERVVARPAIRTTDYASIRRIAVAGGGIAPIPDLVAAASVASGALERVLPDWSSGEARLHAISLGGREPPARVRVFREFVRAKLAGAKLAGTELAGTAGRSVSPTPTRPADPP